MELETLNCNNCGAPLSVPETANFVTCNHCNARLAIRRTDSTTFTQQLEQIETTQEQVLEKLAHLQQQNDLARIDREWDREREQYVTIDKHGHRRQPSETMAILTAIIPVLIGLFILFAGQPLGLVFMLIGLFGGAYQYMKAKNFLAARRRYQRRRRNVLRGKGAALQFESPQQPPTSADYLNQLSKQQSSDGDN